MNSIIDGDITQVLRGIICHQVNCKGVMGAGLAKKIKEAHPQVYFDYMKAHRNGNLKLGNIVETHAYKELYILSLCSQENYGRGNILYTDYEAFRTCLQGVKLLQSITNLTVFFPYKIGCGLANGDWNLVSKYINHILPDAFIIKPKL